MKSPRPSFSKAGLPSLAAVKATSPGNEVGIQDGLASPLAMTVATEPPASSSIGVKKRAIVVPASGARVTVPELQESTIMVRFRVFA